MSHNNNHTLQKLLQDRVRTAHSIKDTSLRPCGAESGIQALTGCNYDSAVTRLKGEIGLDIQQLVNKLTSTTHKEEDQILALLGGDVQHSKRQVGIVGPIFDQKTELAVTEYEVKADNSESSLLSSGITNFRYRVALSIMEQTEDFATIIVFTPPEGFLKDDKEMSPPSKEKPLIENFVTVIVLTSDSHIDQMTHFVVTSVLKCDQYPIKQLHTIMATILQKNFTKFVQQITQ